MSNTLMKGLRLMELVARGDKPMGVTELATASGLPKSGTHRLLQALVAEGYVRKQYAGRYRASIKLWELGSSALLGHDLRRHAGPVMEELMAVTDETVHLSVLDGRDVVYLHKVDCPHTVRQYSQIGGRAPAHCVATGKAMMAFCSPMWLEFAIQSLPRATERTIVEPSEFMAHVRRIRSQGYAINLGEWRPHVNGLAAPVFDASGAVIAAIGISGQADSLGAQRLGGLAQWVVRAADDLSGELGRAVPHSTLRNVMHRWAAA